ncbi:MAG: ABC transporter ATP-binding protein [Thermomicrobiales bacterium]|nr:ABC transporter ATP-binding protein [Thermomicrobiales bacterium]
MTIVLTDVVKTYGAQTPAVRGITLEIQDGEFFTLLGPSGCGKTTTLRMIAGLESVTSGAIVLRGRDVTDVPARDRDVAMVFQSYALYPHMTVRDNLGLNLQVRRISKKEVRERIEQVARMLQLEGLLDRKPGQLSGGQRQRVALGRAVIRRPNVFLMDEPLSNLDLKLREETRTELKKLHESLRITTVYVTHDQSEALVLSDRIGVMNDGELLQVGNPHEVYSRPADVFVARFIGSPSINIFAGSIRGNGAKPAVEVVGPGDGTGALTRPIDLGWTVTPPSGQVLLGVRPEDLVIHRSAAPDRLRAVVEFVQPMGSVSYAVLRIPDGDGLLPDREHIMAAIGPDETIPHGTVVWLDIRGDRFCLFNSQSGMALTKA